MYAKGMTTRDISDYLKTVYGVDASAEMISKMTDRILPIAREWQNRPLDRKYAIVFMDAVHYKIRQDNAIVKKAVNIAIGRKLNGSKEVLGMWVGGNESAKYWLSVLNETKNRGVEDIMIVSVVVSYSYILTRMIILFPCFKHKSHQFMVLIMFPRRKFLLPTA